MALTWLWLWIGAAGMTIGALSAAWRLVADGRHRTHYAVLTLIPLIAALAYVAMALGIGRLRVDGGTLYLARYVDWLLTTPLLVLYLGLLCRPDARVYAALVGTDVAIIASGVVAGVLASPAKWVAYGIGLASYLGLLYLLLAVLPRQSTLADDRVAAVFTKLRNLTVVLWTLYPVVWLLGPLGVGLLDVSTEVLVVTYLDLISKVGFVIIALNGRGALAYVSDASGASGTSGASGGPATGAAEG